MLEGHKAGKLYAEERLAKKDEIQAFTEVNWKRQEIQIKRGDPNFEEKMKGFVYSMERDIRYAIRDIEMFEQRIANWKPGMIHKRAEPEADGMTP